MMKIIELKAVKGFIDGIEQLSELQKTFYKRYIENHYKKLLVEAKVKDLLLEMIWFTEKKH